MRCIPTRPLHIEAAWGPDGKRRGILDGNNHQFEFCMIVRGWRSYPQRWHQLKPPWGIGFLEYRNLLSNYGQYSLV